MKKISSLLLLILISITSLSAQWQVGISGGYSLNSLDTDNSFAYGLKNSDRGGYNFAALCGYEFTDWFTLKAELAYTQKNYETHRTIAPLETTYTEYTNGYFQIPLYASLSFGGKKVRGFINLGFYGGYWAYGWVAGALTDVPLGGEANTFSHSYDFNSKADNRLEAGALGGLGLMYNIDKHFALTAEARLQYSLTDIQKSYTEYLATKYYNTLLFNIGVLYKF